MKQNSLATLLKFYKGTLIMAPIAVGARYACSSNADCGYDCHCGTDDCSQNCYNCNCGSDDCSKDCYDCAGVDDCSGNCMGPPVNS